MLIARRRLWLRLEGCVCVCVRTQETSAQLQEKHREDAEGVFVKQFISTW